LSSRSLIALIVFVSIFPWAINAQVSNDEGRAGSVYSGLGLGLPVDFRSPVAEGMGIIGVSITDSDVTNLSNPAFWGSSVLTRGAAGFSLDNFISKETNSEIENTLFAPHHFQLEFPLAKNKLGFSLSMTQLTSADFRTVSTNVLLPNENPTADTVNFALENRKNGGVNRFEMGIGWKINNNISVGYAGSVYFGSTTSTVSTGFGNLSFEDVNINERVSHTGFGNRIGILLSKGKLFSDTDRLTAGATFNLPVDLEADRELTTDANFQNRGTGNVVFQTLSLPLEDGADDGEFRFPMQAAAGITYEFSSVWSVSTEVMFQKWSDYENINGQQQDFMKDRYRVGIGGNFHPFNRNSDPFFAKFKYRMGVTYDSGHLEFAENNIDALFLNAGFSFLSRGSRSSIDFNFQYGIRGTTADNLVKENIMGMKVTFNLSELMFERRKFR